VSAWVALEGGEGTGKSTQARLLADSLGAVLTREPGGTRLGERVRSLLLGHDAAGIDARAEALLMAADRAEHMATLVGPALAAGRTVVSERSAWSSLAYQGYGRGLPLDDLRRLSDFALRGRWPDLAVLVVVPDDVIASRLESALRWPDRIEIEGGGFHERVGAGFRELAASSPERWAEVDGMGAVEEVAARILAVVRSRLGT
jgi:dTMP kinase